MTLLSIQEQQVQAQHGIQLSQEEYEQQCMAIDVAWSELTSEDERQDMMMQGC